MVGWPILIISTRFCFQAQDAFPEYPHRTGVIEHQQDAHGAAGIAGVDVPVLDIEQADRTRGVSRRGDHLQGALISDNGNC